MERDLWSRMGGGDGDPGFELCYLDAGEPSAVSFPLRGQGCSQRWVQARADQADRAWKRRTMPLIESDPRQVAESSAQALFEAAAYPEAIAAAAARLVRE